MASIAQALSTVVSASTNASDADSATPQTAVPSQDSVPSRPHDTVDLTETGSRNVSVPALRAARNQPPAFQVAYFPPSGAPGAAASALQNSNPTAQVASAAASAASSSPLSPTQSANLSAASQAKLQQLNQILQGLGINPDQISFSARIALLPLVNDPAAIEQYVQGLPAQTAVLNPATQVLAPASSSRPSTATAAPSSHPAVTTLSVARATSFATPNERPTISSNSTQLSSENIPPAAQPSAAPGLKVNISV
jgi:hypothetical protein